MKRLLLIIVICSFAQLIPGQATITTQSESATRALFKKIELTLMRYPSMAFVPRVWHSRPFLRPIITNLENNSDLQRVSMLYISSNPEFFAKAVEGLSGNKDSFYQLLSKLNELGFNVNQSINNTSLLSLALGKNFDALAKIVTPAIYYNRTPDDIVLSPEQTEQLKQLIAQTADVQNDITYSVIVLSPEFPQLLSSLVDKGLRIDSTQFVNQILILFKYDNYSPELLLNNLKALFDQGATPFAPIQYTQTDGTAISITPREYAQQFIHRMAVKNTIIELIDQATNRLKR